MNLTPDKPTARDLLDRCRILTHSILEIDEHGPNYVLDPRRSASFALRSL